jgi:hypothetical protein
MVTNLGERGRRRRYLMGALGLVASLALAAAFLLLDVARGARLVLFLPLLVAALGFLQARSAT